jgi:Rieske Fe-S protein
MIDRRTFVRRLSGAAAGASCAVLAAACAGLPYVTGAVHARGIRVLRADLEGLDFALLDLADGGSPVFLATSADGFTAVSTRCTHRGCAVSPEAGVLACPCHGSRFQFDGTLLEGPAPRALDSFAVEEEADHIIILTAA